MADRILAAHQPNYLPWLGYLSKVGQADVFVVADDVQYTTVLGTEVRGDVSALLLPVDDPKCPDFLKG